eukprot:TRINITY_DN7587_c0_g1_i1.p1 TRINITY_DN7587_c0_g1~~TRINITY_DN7587_c0_g1_i1.p1  ORF type:complete len:330 (+),score=50.84 TRINITY_DN7587_c0_g1_i1:230-1219(+)
MDLRSELKNILFISNIKYAFMPGKVFTWSLFFHPTFDALFALGLFFLILGGFLSYYDEKTLTFTRDQLLEVIERRRNKDKKNLTSHIKNAVQTYAVFFKNTQGFLSLFFRFDKGLGRFDRAMIFYTRIIVKSALASIFANMSALGKAVRIYVMPFVIFTLAMVFLIPLRMLLRWTPTTVVDGINIEKPKPKPNQEIKRRRSRFRPRDTVDDEEISAEQADLKLMSISQKGKWKKYAGYLLMISLILPGFYMVVSISLLARDEDQISWNDFLYRLFLIDQLLLPLIKCLVYLALISYVQQMKKSVVQVHFIKLLDKQILAELVVRTNAKS